MAGAIRATVHYHGILCCFKLRAHDIRKACMRIYISARVCVWSTVHMDAFGHEERARGRACKHSIVAFSAVRGDVQSPRRPCERERKRERKRPRAFVPTLRMPGVRQNAGISFLTILSDGGFWSSLTRAY